MQEDDKRRERRPRVLKGATITTGTQNSEIACTIRNQHQNGAELKVPIDARVPERFLLYVAVDGIAYHAEVRWRSGDRVGVAFTGTAPKPRFHY